MSALRDDLLARLEAAGDPARAPQQQRYMKSALPFHGVRVPEVRRITARVAAAHPLESRDRWEAEVLDLWRRATHREQRYAATALAWHRPYRRWLDGTALPMIEEMIVTGAWWDHVDDLAGHHVGCMLTQDRAGVRPVLWAWADDDLARAGALWRRRTAILCQLGAGADTDVDLLFHAIDASMEAEEFFLQKAIGWALRQYARTEPASVRAYLDRHDDRLSSLSKREARKHL